MLLEFVLDFRVRIDFCYFLSGLILLFSQFKCASSLP